MEMVKKVAPHFPPECWDEVLIACCQKTRQIYHDTCRTRWCFICRRVRSLKKEGVFFRKPLSDGFLETMMIWQRFLFGGVLPK